MRERFVQVLSEVHCDWDRVFPEYRVYVNHELFAERTWVWKNEYLEECLQISAPPGRYKITYELINPTVGNLYTENMRVVEGPGEIANGFLEIFNENA